MFIKTIKIKFESETDLPKWAIQIPQVVKLCEKNLSFRCDVCSATHSGYKQSLIKQAKLHYNNHVNT